MPDAAAGNRRLPTLQCRGGEVTVLARAEEVITCAGDHMAPVRIMSGGTAVPASCNNYLGM
jgi:hypothetical protein